MKIVTYNIHKGMDSNNIFTLNKIIKYLKNIDADIICLQEVLYEQFAILKHNLKMDGVFAANINSPTLRYGIATFSKYEILKNEHIFLKSKKEQISEIMDYINLLDKSKIICGDFNEKNIFINIFNDSSICTDYQNIATFEKSNARIDYILLDKCLEIEKYYIDKINLSDHYPVIVHIK